MEWWQCWVRWWEGWRVGGPWPAWPSEGIRFDWIGAGDLCIKLRLPCDPVFCREIHTAVRGRACWGSPLTSYCLIRLGFAQPCWVRGSWVVLIFYSITLCSGPLCSVLICCIPICSVGFLFNSVLFPLVWFSCPASIHSSLFHFIMLISILFTSPLFFSILFHYSRTKVSPSWSCWFWLSELTPLLQGWHH